MLFYMTSILYFFFPSGTDRPTERSTSPVFSRSGRRGLWVYQERVNDNVLLLEWIYQMIFTCVIFNRLCSTNWHSQHTSDQFVLILFNDSCFPVFHWQATIMGPVSSCFFLLCSFQMTGFPWSWNIRELWFPDLQKKINRFRINKTKTYVKS